MSVIPPDCFAPSVAKVRLKFGLGTGKNCHESYVEYPARQTLSQLTRFGKI